MLKCAAKEQSDVIVIGSNSRNIVDRIRGLGSVARKVAEDAPCQVLIVR
ncbi:universal stress protein [Candidatus Nitrososphaera evergladensis]